MHCNSKDPRIFLLSFDRDKSSISAIQSEKMNWKSELSLCSKVSLCGYRFQISTGLKQTRGGISSLILKLSPGNVFFQTLTLSHAWKWAEQDYWSHYLIISSLFRLWPSPHNWRRRTRGCLCARPRPTGRSSSSKITTGLSSSLYQYYPVSVCVRITTGCVCSHKNQLSSVCVSL